MDRGNWRERRGGHRGRGGFRWRGHQGNAPLRGGRDDGFFRGGEYDAPRGRGGSPYKEIWPIGYKKLQEIEEKENPRTIVTFLASSRCGLEERLRGDGGVVKHGMAQMLLKVFGKMSESDGPNECFVRVLQLILKYDFHEKITGIIYELLANHRDRSADTVTHLKNALKLMRAFLTVIPSTSEKKVTMTMMILKPVVDGLGEMAGDVQDSYQDVQGMLDRIKDKQKEKNERTMQRKPLDDLHSQPAPDDFRSIPVFPQLNDIHADDKPFLRTNLVDKAYLNPDHYLDVQFRLLREDFVRPLREGINEIIQYGEADQRKRRYQNVKVYQDVKVEFTIPDQRGIMHRLHFSTERLQKVRWRNTKRLLYGNLLCLSSDQFKNDVLFAVVTDRKAEDLSEGYISVQFVYDDEQEDDEDDHMDLLDPDEEMAAAPRPRIRALRRGARADIRKIYTMVETDAYFEAYRHVLAGLKATEHVPLERYIVRCSKTMHAPEYLRPFGAGRVSYDFSPLTKNERKVEVLHYDWPSADELGLNRSQAEAFKLALTNELAIIQGPPGTGKTYVGLAIMKILLKNKTSWFTADARSPEKTHCPILVVCYTNHALDQFLEGIAKFSNEDQMIIRVGGRCKNEVTKKFSLNEIRRKKRQSGERTADCKIRRSTIWSINSDLRDIEHLLQVNVNKLEASLHCIQKLLELESVIPRNLFSQFNYRRYDVPFYWQDPNTPSPDEVLLSWLGLTNVQEDVDFEKEANNLPQLTIAILLSMNHTMCDIGKALHATGESDSIILHDYIVAQSKENKAQGGFGTFVNEQGDEEEDEIMEEADLLQQHRFLDTDEYERGQRIKAEDNQRQVKRLMSKMAALSFRDIGASSASNKEQGWQQSKYDKKKARQRVKRELGKTTTMTENEEKRIRDINSLRPEDRWRLYRTWVSRWRDQFRVGSDAQIEKFNSLARQLEELKKQEDAEILQEADVVAVTTTGAAKYRDLIYKLNSKIVVVEEAAEVLEAHIITAMPRDTKHLILIGDHQQLKPSATVYELAKRYNLDTSLFERLINVSIPHVTLNCQHRMRPEIADLLRPHIYKELDDHETVLDRGEITGMEKSLFFLSHNVPEENLADGKSKMNQYEADFMVALCKYLIMQGYEPEQITILAMYTGQLFAFRSNMKEEVTRGVRVTAVDNFQGEENDIILLSLVRSNEEEKIGFLGIENRICVALSRAKNALYCIGNMELLGSKSSTWRKVIGILNDKDSIGEAFMLQCKHHPNKLTPVKTVEDFRLVPEGGCGQPCATRLPCGHVCTRPCHPEDHSEYECLKPCDKILSCEHAHRCRKKCSEPCGSCTVKVPKTIPLCGHQQNILCSQDPYRAQCKEMIQVPLPCGHQYRCHCYKSNSLTASMCKEKCQEYLECDHTCKGSCGECFQGRLHVPCMAACGRTLVCGHSCESKCSSCPPCEHPCKTRCTHGKCGKQCGESCILCREKCQWQCPHYKCNMLCSEPCDRPPCNRPCPKLIGCKHPCIGLCGEPCPELCRVCHKDEVQDVFFGDEDEADARFVLLEDCGHIFTYQALDKWMDQEEPGNQIKMKACPRCKTAIWRSTRYGNIINKLLNSVNNVKAKIWGDAIKSEQNRIDLLQEIETKEQKFIYSLFGNEIRKIKDQIKRKPPPSKVLLLESQYRRLEKLKKLNEARLVLSIDGITVRKMLDAVERDCKSILKWVFLHRTHATNQEDDSFRKETERIQKALEFIKVNEKYKCMVALRQRELSPFIRQLKIHLLDSVSPYDDQKKQAVECCFKELFEKAPQLSFSLGISEEEKKMICTAMGFASKGHWYTCSKGHIYAIGDCGGATETSNCPICKEEIGGTGHRLVSTNRVATEMDGATRPAYDPQMNYIPPALMDDLREQGFQ